MKRQQILKPVIAALWLAAPGAFCQGAPRQAVLQELEALKARVAAQQQEIEALKAKLQQTSLDKEEVKKVVQSQLAEAKGASVFLGPNIDSLNVKGDVRFRYEHRTKDTGNIPNEEENRDRFRTRFRLGMLWTNSTEDWEVGAGLATGGDDGRSTNDTWNENQLFETGDIRLDYAYAKHKWDNLTITIGQQRNPFVTSFILWDSDLRPTGFTVQAHTDNVFATLGGYDVLWGANLKGDADDRDVRMIAGQCGVKYETEGGLGFLGAVGVYVFSDSFREAADKAGGGTDPYKHSAGLYKVDDSYDLRLGDLYAQAAGNLGDLGVKAYGHVVKNFGADGAFSQQGGTIDPSDNDLAWLLGVSVKYGRLKLGIAYAHIEADSVFGPMKDSDFGETAGLDDTNLDGWKLGLRYDLTKHFSLGATAMLVQEVEGNKDGQLYQLDAVYKF